MNSLKKLRCLELYSGVGGMHYALQESGLPVEIIMAADINTVVNDIYKYNFAHTKQYNKCLTNLSIDELESLAADMILMSPPCQPFTRVGKQMDEQDGRTKSFLHILELMLKLKKKPDYLLVENVQGFEQSLCRKELLCVLTTLKFVFQEFMLTPLQFGIPNSRLRYYLIAKRSPLKFSFCTSPEIQCSVPSAACQTVEGDDKPNSLENYLENNSADYFKDYLIPSGLIKYFWVMDLVSKTSESSCCFTKRYGRMVKGAGSVLQMSNDESIDFSVYRNGDTVDTTSAGFLAAFAQLQLRFFTPREIANLLCFPKHFELPSGVSTLQSYRVLGNSINVKVVAALLKLLTHGDPTISCLP